MGDGLAVMKWVLKYLTHDAVTESVLGLTGFDTITAALTVQLDVIQYN